MSKTVEYCLAISHETLGDGAPVPLQGDLDSCFKTAAGLGFDAFEYHLRNPETVDRKKLKVLLKKHKLTLAAVGTGLEYTMNGNSFTSKDPEVRKRTAAKFKSFIDIAGDHGAAVFLGLCRAKAPTFKEREAYLDLFADQIRPLIAYAKERGAVLALEPIVSYMTNLLCGTVETIDYISLKDLAGVELLLDTYHIFFEDKMPVEEAFRVSSGLLAHVHISDSDRRYPGSGKVDYAAVGRVLKEIGYGGAVSLEILPYPDGVQAARYGIQWMRSVWG